MRVEEIYRYIYLGTNIWFLQSTSQGRLINGDGHVRDNIEKLYDSLTKYGLFVTQRSAYGLVNYCRNDLSEDDGAALSKEQSDRIIGLANNVRATLDAESLGLFAHIVTDKRYSASALLNDPWQLFADHVKQRLDDIAIIDFEEAARCIAYERPTAAAFHLLRGTESVLKHWYCHLVRRNRAQLMWGPMITSLRGRRNPPEPAVLDHLDGLRRNFRNPTQHPEKVYDLTESQDLFGVCIDVINRMAMGLPVRS